MITRKFVNSVINKGDTKLKWNKFINHKFIDEIIKTDNDKTCERIWHNFLAQDYIFISLSRQIRTRIFSSMFNLKKFEKIDIKSACNRIDKSHLIDYCTKYSIDPEYVINCRPNNAVLAYADFLNHENYHVRIIPCIIGYYIFSMNICHRFNKIDIDTNQSSINSKLKFIKYHSSDEYAQFCDDYLTRSGLFSHTKIISDKNDLNMTIDCETSFLYQELAKAIDYEIMFFDQALYYR